MTELAERPFPWVRALVAGALFLFMNYDPLTIQGLGWPFSKWQHTWQMYSGHAADLCQVTYERALPDGGWETVDRRALLNSPRWDLVAAPRLIKEREGVRAMGGTLCRKIGMDQVIRASGRCASRHGWKKPFVDENVCSATPPEPKRKRKAP